MFRVCYIDSILLSAVFSLTVIVREAHAQMSFLDLLHENILLVEEQYDGRGGEVAMVTDAVEQVQTLMHSVLWFKTEDHGFSF